MKKGLKLLDNGWWVISWLLVLSVGYFRRSNLLSSGWISVVLLILVVGFVILLLVKKHQGVKEGLWRTIVSIICILLLLLFLQ